MTLHQVLVPIDGSDFSRRIFDHIKQFLPPDENALLLLRVGEPPMGHVGRPARAATLNGSLVTYETTQDITEATHPIYASQERESAEAMMQDEMMDDVHALQAAGYSVRSYVRFGDPGKAIVDFAENHDVEMVAMTTHWRQGIDRLVFGSVAKHVAQHLSLPLLMVRG